MRNEQDRQRLIIGLGTGRSGTQSLSTFLSAHRGICVLHEGRVSGSSTSKVFGWENDEEAVVEWLAGLQQAYPDHAYVGDVGMYYLNYVDHIIRAFPSTLFICMQRSKRAVVRSYMRKTYGFNHWMHHEGKKWQKDARWDSAYPKFSARSKKDAISQYWDFYAARIKQLGSTYPGRLLIVHLEEFDRPECREQILDFIGYTGLRKTEDAILMNTGSKMTNLAKRLRRSFWRLKRSLFGSPATRS